jgi:4-amino-4-deoxy-L-arabinose transferase-like glycosyltransferase
LAAFGLLSMPRSLTSLLDWFAVVVFTSLGSLIWLYWSAMSFGFPQNLASRLTVFAPGLKNPMPGPLEVFFGVAISGAWIVLVLWRIRRGSPRLWRPVVLSAGGLVLAWILMMSLWMPALDINRGYNHLLPRLERAALAVGGCIRTAPDDRTSRALVLASQRLTLGALGRDQDCGLLLTQVGPQSIPTPPGAKLIWTGQRAADRKDRERYLLYRLTDKK